MPFNTSIFFFFFLLLFGIYHFLIRGRRARLWLIVFASCICYAGCDYRFIPLLLGTSLLDFFIARAIEYGKPEHRKSLLTVSVVLNLGVLAFFKYTNFFVDSAYTVFHALGWNIPTP